MSNEAMERKIATDFDRAYDALVSLGNAKRARIPEPIFRSIFLPLFANLENQRPEGTIYNWVALAGSQFNSVDVIDEKGVLFTVPPLFSQQAVRPQESDRSEPISKIISVAEMLAARSPIESNNYIANRFHAVGEHVRNNVDRIQYAREWNIIFEYYGLPKLVELGKDAEKKSDPNDDIKNELKGDDLEFTSI